MLEITFFFCKKDLQKGEIIASINNCRRAMSRKARGAKGRQKNRAKPVDKKRQV